jgi:hypothetical protein
MTRAVRPVQLETVGLEGKWVAVKEGRILTAKETADAVYRDVLEHPSYRNATIIRVPSEGEPELVGLG